ncbi:methyltransferase domain-containing protein [Zoogloeaceae bacterium G21618-S1]|nr:methyltransferase domain-containing protein [Zoogloeaceae bacterium G21618-S1]
MPSASTFWDRIAERYARQPIVDEAAYQKKLQLTREHFTPDMHVLEFGCGTGSTALAHAPYVAHIHAIDISPKMLDIARQKAAAAHIDNVTFELANIDTLDETGPRFDAVMGHSILHLLDNKDAAIAKVYRLLTPGGVFVSSTMCLGDSLKMRVIKAFVSVGAVFGLLPRLRAFTQKALLDSFRKAGFDIAHHWQPKANRGVFIIARKPAETAHP